jgi:sigma-B regulation protein RsbU (phosphoserine phosphatase)
MFILKFWRRLRIAYKLVFAFGALSLLLFWVAGSSYIALRDVTSASERVINTNFSIERLVLEMNAGMQSARQRERSFILRYPEIGYENAYELYGRGAVRDLDEVIAASEQLRDILQDVAETNDQASGVVALFLSLAEQYKASYLDVTAAIELLAVPDVGLEDRIARALTNLGLYAANQNIIDDMYDDVFAAQQTYLRNKQADVLQSAIAEVERIVETTDLLFNSDRASDQNLRGGIRRAAENYIDIANQLISVNSHISNRLARMDLQANSIAPASERLLTLAQRDTERAQQDTARIQRLANTTMLTSALVAVVLALLISMVLNRSITKNVETLSWAAGSLRAGNLAVNVDIKADDEIGVLAGSFNSMAAQLRSLVGNLEERVAERTSDLVKANEEIQRLNVRLQEDNLRMESELDLTRRLQKMVLPGADEMRQIDALDIASYMSPATEVGGDYYDVLRHGDKIKIGIGDVTGHGLESGILMLMTQTAVRTLMSSDQHDPTQFLSILNHTVYHNLKRMSIDKSLTLSLLDYQQHETHGEVRFSGQHEHVLVLRAGGEVELHDTMDLGFPLGLEEDISGFIDELHIALQVGDGVVLYTDGITEAEDEQGQQYGLMRLSALLSRNWHQPADAICQQVVDDVYAYIGNAHIYDDITLLVIKQR